MSKEQNQACQVPLVELLRSVPIGYRASWESHWNEAGDAIGHTMSPLGRHAHDAADRIEALEKLLAVAACPQCDGSGAVSGADRAVCCNRPTDSGECCNNPVPEQTMEPCQFCEERYLVSSSR